VSDIQYLEVEEVIEIHELALDRHGGKSGFNGPQGFGLVESAVNRPRNKAHYEGVDLLEQAGALFFGLAKNHGFADGNKRIAVAATNAFLLINGWKFGCDNDTLASFTERCSDQDWTEDAVIAFVRRHAIRFSMT
jgi:death-on-curing protein